MDPRIKSRLILFAVCSLTWIEYKLYLIDRVVPMLQQQGLMGTVWVWPAIFQVLFIGILQGIVAIDMLGLAIR